MPSNTKYFLPHFGRSRYLSLLESYVKPEVSSVFLCCGSKSIGKSKLLRVAKERWMQQGQSILCVDLKSCDGTFDSFVRLLRAGVSSAIQHNQHRRRMTKGNSLFRSFKNAIGRTIIDDTGSFDFLKMSWRLLRWHYGITSKYDLDFFRREKVAELSRGRAFSPLTGLGLWQRGMLLTLYNTLASKTVSIQNINHALDIIDRVDFDGVLILQHLQAIYPKARGATDEDSALFRQFIVHMFCNFQRRKHIYSMTPTVVEVSDTFLHSIADVLLADPESFAVHRLWPLNKEESLDLFSTFMAPMIPSPEHEAAPSDELDETEMQREDDDGAPPPPDSDFTRREEQRIVHLHERVWDFAKGHPGSLFQLHLHLQEGWTLDEALDTERELYQMLLNFAVDAPEKLEVLKRFTHTSAFVLEHSDPYYSATQSLVAKGVLQSNGYAVSPVHEPMATAIRAHTQSGASFLSSLFGGGGEDEEVETTFGEWPIYGSLSSNDNDVGDENDVEWGGGLNQSRHDKATSSSSSSTTSTSASTQHYVSPYASIIMPHLDDIEANNSDPPHKD